MAAFSDAIADCRLSDLGFRGLPFTWDNRQEAERNVKARLDRALGDEKFLEVLSDSVVQHIPLAESDHCVLLVEVKERTHDRCRRRQRKMKPFRYENMWKSHGEYIEFVNRTWDPGTDASDLFAASAALSSMQFALKRWDREVFGSVKQQVKDLRAELELERSQSLYRGPTETDRQGEIHSETASCCFGTGGSNGTAAFKNFLAERGGPQYWLFPGQSWSEGAN